MTSRTPWVSLTVGKSATSILLILEKTCLNCLKLSVPRTARASCQSQVWIDERIEEGKVQLAVDSDAFIVKGLLCIIKYNNRTSGHLDFDIDAYFAELELLNHLSPPEVMVCAPWWRGFSPLPAVRSDPGRLSDLS